MFRPWDFHQWYRAGAAGPLATQLVLAAIGVGGLLAVCGWIGYAFHTGRNIKQRLTDPAPIHLRGELEPAR